MEISCYKRVLYFYTILLKGTCKIEWRNNGWILLLMGVIYKYSTNSELYLNWTIILRSG